MTPDALVLSDGKLDLVRTGLACHVVHKVPTHFFDMVRSGTDEVVGSINLRCGSTAHLVLYAGHIGYTVFPEYRGHRYAARAVRLLQPFARSVGFHPLWITTDPENVASRRTLEIAGAEFVEIVDVPGDCIIFQSGHPRKCRYLL